MVNKSILYLGLFFILASFVIADSNLVSLNLKSSLVVTPATHVLYVNIRGPTWFTNTQITEFKIDLEIIGPATFEDGTNKTTIDVGNIDESQTKNITIISNKDNQQLDANVRVKASANYRINGKLDAEADEISYSVIWSQKGECLSELDIYKQANKQLEEEKAALNANLITKDEEINTLKNSQQCPQTSYQACSLECATFARINANYLIWALLAVIVVLI